MRLKMAIPIFMLYLPRQERIASRVPRIEASACLLPVTAHYLLTLPCRHSAGPLWVTSAQPYRDAAPTFHASIASDRTRAVVERIEMLGWRPTFAGCGSIGHDESGMPFVAQHIRRVNKSNWLCLDCGKNTFLHNDHYYMLRNTLWRELVPREQRHGMLCLSCVSKRLGRPLQPQDFKKDNQTIDESDPNERGMELQDYGIIDALTPAMLGAIDEGLIDGMTSSRARRVARMIGTFMDAHTSAVPGLPDYYYLMRIETMIDSRVLVITKEADLLIQCEVRLA
jgi:hypothetical protein